MQSRAPLILFFLCLGLEAKKQFSIKLSTTDRAWIGKKIWYNECKGSADDLTYWKEHEYWASIGIGHWIWHPANAKSIYQETIQELFAYLATQGKPLPKALGTTLPIACPWRSREQFLKELQSPAMSALRSHLLETIPEQTAFIIKRLENALEKIIESAPSAKEQRMLSKKLAHLIAQRQGLYALIDYLNFKGEGLGTANYNGHKWGLLQVLQAMKIPSKKNACHHFALAAKQVLQKRIDHCPVERKKAEEGWREGWFNRLDSYTKA